MTPLQKIAMGLLIVVVVARFGGWDALPNPVGWLLVIAGVRAATGHLASTRSMTVLAGLALAVSVATYPPGVEDGLDEAAVWLIGLPTVAFEVVLCTTVAAVLGRRDGRWFRTLGWLLVAVGVGPAVAVGTGDPVFADITLGAWAVSQLALVWLLFSASGRPETGARPRPVRPSSQADHAPRHHPPPESLS